MSRIEEAMVKGFPFEVPQEYANLPQLKVGANFDQFYNFLAVSG